MAAAARSGFKGMFMFLMPMAVAAVIFWPMFSRGMTGAGDIKMAMLIIGYLGFRKGMSGIATGVVLGAALGIIKLLKNRSAGRRLRHFKEYLIRSARGQDCGKYYDLKRDGSDGVIPLGACLFLGAALSAAGYIII